MIEACIFDLDGVIVDTAKYHFLAWKRLADHLEINFTEADNEKMKGISRVDSLERMIALGERSFSDRDKQKFCATKNTWYLEYVKQMTNDEILSGVIPFLDELADKKIKIALGSASKNARKVLDLTGITNRFAAIVDGNEVVYSKPHPEVFLKGASMLGVLPKHTIVFENSAKGIEAAIAGGFISVGIGSQTHLGHGDMVIPSFENMNLDKIVSELEKVAVSS